jgi:hypothetical protein
MLIIAAGSMAGPSTINPSVKSAVTITVAVNNEVYIIPLFLLREAAAPAHAADKKLTPELTYPKLCSLHPNSFINIELKVNNNTAHNIHENIALSKNPES